MLNEHKTLVGFPCNAWSGVRPIVSYCSQIYSNIMPGKRHFIESQADSDSESIGSEDTLPLYGYHQPNDDKPNTQDREFIAESDEECDAPGMHAAVTFGFTQSPVHSPPPPPTPGPELVEEDTPSIRVGTRSRNWCFTVNNYDDSTEELLGQIRCRYIVYGREVGQSGTPHLQGQIVYTNDHSFNQVRNDLPLGAHIEMTQSLGDSIEYCKKDGNFVERGDMPAVTARERGKKGGEAEKARWQTIKEQAQSGKLEDVEPKVYVLHLKNLEHVYHRTVRQRSLENTTEPMYWYYGPTGTGKSRAARTEYPNAYLKMINKWWDGYIDEDTVLIEDVDPDCGKWMAHFFKVWTDHYPFMCECKGNTMKIRPARIIVTSNYQIHEVFPRPEDYLPLYRRFDVFKFPQLDAERVHVHKRGEAFVMQPVGFNQL